VSYACRFGNKRLVLVSGEDTQRCQITPRLSAFRDVATTFAIACALERRRRGVRRHGSRCDHLSQTIGRWRISGAARRPESSGAHSAAGAWLDARQRDHRGHACGVLRCSAAPGYGGMSSGQSGSQCSAERSMGWYAGLGWRRGPTALSHVAPWGCAQRFSKHGHDEPPRVYRRVFGSIVRLLFYHRSGLYRRSPLLRSA
jgi:hypothetical protein